MKYQKSAETKQRILQVSKSLFYDLGYDATTIRQITKLADLQNQATFYYYFLNKVELVFSIMDDFFINTNKLVEQHITDQNDYLLRFACIQVIQYKQITQNPQVRRFYAEFEGKLNFNLLKQSSNLFTNLVYNLAHEYNSNLDDNLIDFYYSAYAATIGKAISNIENNTWNLTLDECIKYLKTFFPKLIKIDDIVIEEKFDLADRIIGEITPDELNKAHLLK